ncbi:unnamed protein product [Pedinophyceae sp. YPF-701]|nr:unnamed protein product [Pedinophyceae sp. YPF-701]
MTIEEKFTNVHLISDDGSSSEKVTLSVGLDKVRILTPSGLHAIFECGLTEVGNQELRGSLLTILVKPSAGSTKELVLQGDGSTMQNVADTLMTFSLQAKELQEEEKQTAASERARSEAGAAGVRFWDRPDKEGWMQSQGEHLRTWRRRFFVLKDGYLFRFMAPNPTRDTKPRGTVDLNSASEVTSAVKETGKSASVKVTAGKDSHLFLCDSETEAVEWMSALEGAMHSAVRRAAGLSAAASGAGSGLAGRLQERIAQHERSKPPAAFAARAASPPARRRDDAFDGRAGGYSGRAGPAPGAWRDYGQVEVEVVGYDGSGAGRDARPAQDARGAPPQGGVSFGEYGAIPGVAGLADARPGSLYGGPAPVATTIVDYEPANLDGLDGIGGTAGYNGGGYGYGAPAGPPQPEPAMAGGYSMPPAGEYAAPQPQGAPQVGGGAGAVGWQTSYTPEGQPYYHNPVTGQTQWEAPNLLG